MLRGLLVAALMPGTLAGALAGAMPPAVASDRAIVHGRMIQPSDVGPRTANQIRGYTVPGGIISDTARPSYVRLIETPRDYEAERVPGPHLLAEGVTITGPLDISTGMPVVFRHVTIRLDADSPWGLLVRPEAGAVYLLWSEIAVTARVGGAVMLRGTGARIHRSNIHGAADAIQIGGKNVQVTENTIKTGRALPGDHNDAIQLFDGAADVVIARNRIGNSNPQTSCITVLGRNIMIEDNWLSGGGYVIYGGRDRNGKGGGDATGIRITGNTFDRHDYPRFGFFGVAAYWKSDAEAGNIWSNNTDAQDRPVPAPTADAR